VPNGSAAQVKISVDIRFEGSIKLLVRNLRQFRNTVLIRCVAHQNVEFAECLEGLADALVAEAAIRQISGDQNTFPAAGLDDAPRLLGIGFLGGKINDSHVRPFAGIEIGNRAADAAIPARNQCRLSLQLSGGVVPNRGVSRPRVHLMLEAGFPLMLPGIRGLRFFHRPCAVRAVMSVRPAPVCMSSLHVILSGRLPRA